MLVCCYVSRDVEMTKSRYFDFVLKSGAKIQQKNDIRKHACHFFEELSFLTNFCANYGVFLTGFLDDELAVLNQLLAISL